MLDMFRSRLSKDEDGFTLIELLIVIVILGVLAGIVVFAVGGINDSSKTSACKADLKTVETAAEAYYAQASPHAYAASMAALVTANILREVPASPDYTIVYTVNAGPPQTVSVTATHGAAATAGC